jgi:hypothetical protein
MNSLTVLSKYISPPTKRERIPFFYVFALDVFGFYIQIWLSLHSFCLCLRIAFVVTWSSQIRSSCTQSAPGVFRVCRVLEALYTYVYVYQGFGGGELRQQTPTGEIALFRSCIRATRSAG